MDDKIFGDYTIIEKLGEGSLGTTFLAEHRFIKRQYVLKVLSEDLTKLEGFLPRFEKEISSLAMLDHPHVARVHNVSQTDGKFFVVSDCVFDQQNEIVNLGSYLRKSKKHLTEVEIYQMLKEIASAIDYAHQIKVDHYFLAHRWLKLSNVMMGKNGIVITDFGMAHVLGEGELLSRMYQALATGLKEESPSSLQMAFLQNYAFLAPEQKVYRENGVGAPADAYAFGVLAYFLIMRTFPEGFFPLPSEKRPDLQMRWDHLITECLQPAPARRPTHLEHVLEEIQRVSHAPPSPPAMAPPPEPVAPTPQPVVPEPVAAPPPGTSFYQPAEPQAPMSERVTTMARPNTQSMVRQVSDVVRQAQPKPVIKPQEIDRPTYDPDPGAIFQLESTVTPYKPEEKEAVNVEPILTEMIVIKGGEYYRGSDAGKRDERPRHMIRLKDFAMDVHPVTNEQFVRFLEAMGGEKDANNQDIIRLPDSRIKRHTGSLVIESGYSKHPVIGVTWYGATAYAKWIGKRLPTEAEFEIACRGGLVDAAFPTGDMIEQSQANFFSADTSSVKSFPPNGYGLYDMVGNVYEWCSDWYNYDFYEVSRQEPDQPIGPQQGVYRVLRGGCWKSLKEDLQCAHRHRNNPATVNSTYGFRCSADVD